jgi:hypothetical protein
MGDRQLREDQPRLRQRPLHLRRRLRPPGANVIKLFTVAIYRLSMVILSFCVIKPYYRGNSHGMAVNYHGVCETNVIKHYLI